MEPETIWTPEVSGGFRAGTLFVFGVRHSFIVPAPLPVARPCPPNDSCGPRSCVPQTPAPLCTFPSSGLLDETL